MLRNSDLRLAALSFARLIKLSEIQSVIRLDGGEVTFSIAAASGNMAEMMYGAEKDAVGNGGGAGADDRCSGLIPQGI